MRNGRPFFRYEGPGHHFRVRMIMAGVAGLGAIVIIGWPRWHVQFVGWNSRFDPPDWVKWRVDPP
jgi:hypothetical protein